VLTRQNLAGFRDLIGKDLPFFNKNWQIFAGHTKKAARIRRPVESDRQQFAAVNT
tara:strand:+ start:497 stop:661 length:165 start_codon:yes stop_codon:yes gene_type:complete